MRRIALALALLTLSACKGKPAKSSVGWEQKTPYEKATVLSHVPSSCPGGWLYVDLPAVLKNEATASTAESFTRKIASDFQKSGGKKTSGEVERAFREEGFSPLADTREIAVCYREAESTVFVFGGDYSGKDLFGALQKAITRGGDPAPQVEVVKGVPTLSLGKLAFARVSANVLVMSEDVVAMARLSKANDLRAEWDYQPGRILVAALSGPDHWRFSASESGSDLDLLATSQTKLAREDLEKGRDRIVKRLEDTPLKSIAKTAATTKVEVTGGKATYSLRVSSSFAAETMRTISELQLGEMRRILVYLLAPESASAGEKM